MNIWFFYEYFFIGLKTLTCVRMCAPPTHSRAFWKLISSVSVMAVVNVSCAGCKIDYWRFIKNFHSENSNFIEFLQAHGVLPTTVTCPNCEVQCKYRTDIHQFFCGKWCYLAKTKSRHQCNYAVSICKGSFLDKTHLPSWQIGLFVNHWLQK